MWNSLKHRKKKKEKKHTTLTPTVALKVRNGACSQLLSKLFHWFLLHSAKMNWKRYFHLCCLGPFPWAFLVQSRLFYYDYTTALFWCCWRLSGKPHHSLSYPSSPLPSPPLEVC